jgi:Ras family
VRKETPSSDCVLLTRTNAHRLGHRRNRILPLHHAFVLPWCRRLPTRLRCNFTSQYVVPCPSENQRRRISQTIGFEHARTWLADVRTHADPHLTCILVGNKSDLPLERRQVPTEEGERWAQEEGLLFAEASAKSGANVDAAFEAAARDILVKIRRGVFDDDRVCCPLFLVFLSADEPIIAPVPWCKVFQPRGCRRPGSEESRPDMLRFVIGRIPFEARGV